jgi:hypothetical protein
MISYEPANSPFYTANKKYCEGIEHKLSVLKPNITGYCNSYGYELDVAFERNNLHYSLRFHKHQTTRNGVIIPLNADDKADTEITITGLNKIHKLEIGKSIIRRLFTIKELKQILPSPYFISGKTVPDNLLPEFIAKNKISDFKLNKGKLKISLQKALAEPENFIQQTEDFLSAWR